eukprot:TRINITY_DN55_c0_g3_i1.p1 TRINITY_DN55_c0_g3~~TRINITY_DN55_c0_g3_i1.p1  ORF type:complete len:319 (+),score=90.09 TRINITY_DN55_c0_g3_i1:18-974(+)
MVLGELSSDKSLLSGKAKTIPRVPGSVAPVGTYNHEKKNVITEKSSLKEMLEALSREKKILSNTKLIRSLLDKGKKIKIRIETLEDLIEAKKKFEEEEATRLLSQLNISKVDVDALEWNTPSFSSHSKDPHEEEDDDNTDPLKILSEKEVPASSREKSFNPHVEQLSSKVDELKPIPRFIPYSSFSLKQSSDELVIKAASALTRTKDPSKIRKPSELMPIPPDGGKHSAGVKAISISESLRIQIFKDKELKELQIQRAAAKLSELREVELPSSQQVEESFAVSNPMNYRNKVDVFDDDEESNDSTEFATPEGPSEDES